MNLGKGVGELLSMFDDVAGTTVLPVHSDSPIDINSQLRDFYSVVEFGANHLLLEQKLWIIHCDAYQNIDRH